MKRTVMAHLVAGYTDDATAREAARGLAEGGVSYFEVQLPFSDPSADGKAIQTACASVLQRGYTLDQGLSFVSALRAEFPSIPVFIMTYANLAYRNGLPLFADKAVRAGVSGLIIPDLPFDADEGLGEICAKRGLASVPVAAPSMTPGRIRTMAALGRPFTYAALRAGITGSSTDIDAETLGFLDAVGAGGTKVLGGFGIRTGEQAALLAPRVHAIVAGSVFVDLIRENSAAGPGAVRKAVAAKASELTGICQ
jgi:tryptophan synthase alpha chain